MTAASGEVGIEAKVASTYARADFATVVFRRPTLRGCCGTNLLVLALQAQSSPWCYREKSNGAQTLTRNAFPSSKVQRRGCGGSEDVRGLQSAVEAEQEVTGISEDLQIAAAQICESCLAWSGKRSAIVGWRNRARFSGAVSQKLSHILPIREVCYIGKELGCGMGSDDVKMVLPIRESKLASVGRKQSLGSLCLSQETISYTAYSGRFLYRKGAWL